MGELVDELPPENNISDWHNSQAYTDILLDMIP